MSFILNIICKTMHVSAFFCYLVAFAVLSENVESDESQVMKRTVSSSLLKRVRRSPANLIFKIPLHKDWKQQFVDAHNKYRGEVEPPASNMNKLVWSEQLAELAQKYSATCTFAHSPSITRRTKDYRGVAENIAKGSYNLENVGNIVTRQWYDESAYYDFETRNCESGKVCGHYITAAAAGAELMGCGVSYCNGLLTTANGHLVVCNYWPSGSTHTLLSDGSITPLAPYKAGLSCSKCIPKFSSCENRLCTASPKYNDTTSFPSTVETANKVTSIPLVTTVNLSQTTPAATTTTTETTTITTTTTKEVQHHKILSCWSCIAGSEDECKATGSFQTCNSPQDICETEIRSRNGFPLFIAKSCKQKWACLNDQDQNWKGLPDQCNSASINSVCRCCCSKQHCNLNMQCNPKVVEAAKTKMISKLLSASFSTHIMFHFSTIHSQLLQTLFG